MDKPVAKLIGVDGNIFNLIGITSASLRKAGFNDQATEMEDKCFDSSSYQEALAGIC